ncbi:MAG: pentapeptide repeat-containing protein [Acidimicrobiaceae bacterium]|nr:pentapeptide repeat-containing protein [Acidimicrobiaceae bacterium]
MWRVAPATLARSLARLAVVTLLAFVPLLGPGVDAATPAFAATGTCSGLSWAGCNVAGMDFTGQNLAGADFSGADLAGANFSGVNLQGANLSGANLEGANLTSANMQSATLVSADLAGANLQNVNLQYTTSQNVNFDNADLTGASLQHGTFTGCTDANTTETGFHTAQAVGFPPCSGTAPNVVLTVDCITTNSDGSFTAYFGYTNSGSVISYPVGSANSITPPSLGGSQPTTFVNGTVSNAFSVSVPASGTAVWSVNGVSATATSSSPACNDDTLPAAGNGMGLVVAIGGGAIVGAAVVRRTARGRRVA